jgi:peptidoglycan/xylan/chitin deacetylase (PgdA/CDA1 family)
MRIFSPWLFARWIYPEALFRMNTAKKLLCLTFDDGPDPSATTAILRILENHNIKAIFFCCGENAERYPELIQQILSGGHITGNHSYSHPDGWLTPKKKYTDDILKASKFLQGRFFRPPYGRLSLCQYFKLKKHFKIVFWDVMPYDFDKSFHWEESLKVLMNRIRPGSVIALHDSPDSSSQLYLDMFIGEAKKNGYSFVLPEYL